MLNSPVTYVVDHVLTPEECEEIIHIGKTTGYKKDDVVINNNIEVNKNIRNTELYFVNDVSIYQKIMPHVERLNNSVGWNFSLSRAEPLQIGFYNQGGHYDWHVDDSAEPYKESGPFTGLVRKLSFSILLNNDYSGGEFEIVSNMTTRDTTSEVVQNLNTVGDMILFPSFTPHKVNPVTQGVRISLVGWLCGEPWK